MTKPISDERLRNTLSWAEARLGQLSGAEVIVGAIEEVFALRDENLRLRQAIADALWRQMNGETPVLRTGDVEWAEIEPKSGSPDEPKDDLTIADYEEVLADKRRLVRELDIAINGAGAAKQASLCDILSQVVREGIRSKHYSPPNRGEKP